MEEIIIGNERSRNEQFGVEFLSPEILKWQKGKEVSGRR